MNKKAIAILGGIFILIVGTLGFIIWSQSSGEDEPVVQQPEIVEEEVVEVPEEELEGVEEPETSSSEAVKLTTEGVVTPILFFEGDGITYFNNSGQLFRTNMSVTGNTVLLSNKTEIIVPQKAGISKILWPAVGRSFIAESGTGNSRTWSWYNPDTATYVDLPSEVKSLDWMPSGNKIMFVWVDSSGAATLNISDPDTNNYQVLTDLYDPDYEINVSPDGQTVLFYKTSPTDPTRNTISSVTSDGKIFRTVIADGFNRGVLWSPDGKKFLFSRRDTSTSSYTLFYADVVTGEIRNTGLATTDTKAMWTKDSQYVIAAVPNSGQAGGQGFTSDRVVKVDLVTNNSTSFDLGGSIDVREMFTSQDEKVLFFKNAQDNALYYLIMN